MAPYNLMVNSTGSASLCSNKTQLLLLVHTTQNEFCLRISIYVIFCSVGFLFIFIVGYLIKQSY